MNTKEPVLSQEKPLERMCPTRLALDVVMDKWTPLVIYLLQNGPQRYTQLKRRIDGITQKMLTQTLRKLEKEGLATRTIYPTVPPTVEYALSPLGETLCQPLGEMFQWAKTYGADITSLQERRSEVREKSSLS